METTFIYALNDPETGECRYVGKSDNPKERLREHLVEAPGNRHHRANWIKSLSARGLIPLLEILDEVPKNQWQFWERAWIKTSRLIGMDLTNTTDGGEGTCLLGEKNPFYGKKHKPETVAKLIGKNNPMFGKTGKNNPWFGKTHKPETLAKLSAAKREKKHTNNKTGFIGVFWHTRARRYFFKFKTGYDVKATYSRGFKKLEDAVFGKALALFALGDK